MKHLTFTSHLQGRRLVLALAAITAMTAGGIGVRSALASGTCVDACVAAFGVTFENSAGDFFVLKDCATSDISGNTYCTYARLPALQ